MDELENLGSRIKLIREQLGLNQADFAEKLGLSGPSAVSKYEKAQNEPNIAMLINISKLGNKSLAWLLTGEEPARKELAAEEGVLPGLSPLERVYVDRLLEIFRTKDQGTVSAITQNIDTFLRVPSMKEEHPPFIQEEAAERGRTKKKA